MDTVQTLEWDASRFSPEEGQGLGGTLEITTQMGDDRWRFGGTNFIPGFAAQNGLYLNHWSPRAEVLRARYGRAGPGFTIRSTPITRSARSSAARRPEPDRSLSAANLTRVQWNISDAQILTGSFLVNLSDDRRDGLCFLNPAETTLNRRDVAVRGDDEGPVVGRRRPGGVRLCRYERLICARLRRAARLRRHAVRRARQFLSRQTTYSGRQEWLVNGFVRPLHGFGSHQIEIGTDVERSDLDQTIDRHEFTSVRADNSVVRDVQFVAARGSSA